MLHSRCMERKTGRYRKGLSSGSSREPEAVGASGSRAIRLSPVREMRRPAGLCAVVERRRRVRETLSREGFISTTAIRYCAVLRDIIGGAEGHPVTAGDLWPFLRALNDWRHSPRH